MVCHKCGKKGHIARNCRAKAKPKTANEASIEDGDIWEGDVGAEEIDVDGTGSCYSETEDYECEAMAICDAGEQKRKREDSYEPSGMRTVPIQGQPAPVARNTTSSGERRYSAPRPDYATQRNNFSYRSPLERALHAKVDVPAGLFAGLVVHATGDPSSAGKKLGANA